MSKKKNKQIKRSQVTGDYYRALSLAYAAHNPPPRPVKPPKHERRRQECLRQAKPEKLALADSMRRHMTEAEAYLWRVLRKTELFEAQAVVYGYIPDFISFKHKLIVEVDGPIHETRREYDTERDGHLKRRGYRILRFSNAEILDDRALVIGQIIEQL